MAASCWRLTCFRAIVAICMTKTAPLGTVNLPVGLAAFVRRVGVSRLSLAALRARTHKAPHLLVRGGYLPQPAHHSWCVLPPVSCAWSRGLRCRAWVWDQVGGLTVIGVAGWGLRYHGPYEDVIPAGALNTIVAAGFAIAVAATVGMYGAVSKSKRLLLWFATLAVVIMGVEVIGASLSASWVSRNGNEYLNALANNSSVTGRTADLDAALDEAVAVCCPVAQAGTSWRDVAECEFLAVAGVTPASGCAYAGGSATELKTAVVTFVLDDLVNPLTALTFVLLVPQVRVQLPRGCCEHWGAYACCC